jgi:hypothetical protein
MKNSPLVIIEEIEVIVVVIVEATVAVTVAVIVVVIEVMVVVVIGALIEVVIAAVMITGVEEMEELMNYKDIRVIEFNCKERELAIVIETALVVVTTAQVTATEMIESLADLTEREVGLMNLITHRTIKERQSPKVMGREWQECLVQNAERCFQIGMGMRSLKDRVFKMPKRITENRINC